MATVMKERSIGELLSEITHDATTLVRQEIELAKTEMSEKAARAGKSAGAIAAGGAVLYAGLLILLAAATIGLGHVIGYGWSALLIGLVVTATGGGMVAAGAKKIKEQNFAPEKTQDSIKETKQWAREQMTSG